MTWSAQQLSNARAGLGACDALGGDRTNATQVLTMMITECTLWNYENPLYPVTFGLGDGLPPHELSPSTKNSCGVAQQRPHDPVWWGPPGLTLDEQAVNFMHVDRACSYFVARIREVARSTSPWREIQAVQESEWNGVTIDQSTGLPYPYAENYHSNWLDGYALLGILRGVVPPARTSGQPYTDWLMGWKVG